MKKVLKKALAMISDLTAVPEIGKTYLGKVVRLAEFGAFVEIFPGTDGLLHISEIAEHRVKDVKDELREGDQVLVKVLGIEGNRIKLSRKALLKEQRQKLGLPEPECAGRSGWRHCRVRRVRGACLEDRPRRQPQSGASERQPSSNASTITIEGGDDFDDAGSEDGGEEINFNRADGVPVPVVPAASAAQADQGRVAADSADVARGRGRGPGSGGGNRGPQ